MEGWREEVMSEQFFEQPILNSPYEYPSRYWELDETGQPTQRIIEGCRPAQFITPIPRPKKQKGAAKQYKMVYDDLSSQEQQYDYLASIINKVRIRC